MALSLVLMIANRERQIQIQFQMQIQIVSTLLIRTGTNQAKQNHPMAFFRLGKNSCSPGSLRKRPGLSVKFALRMCTPCSDVLFVAC